MLVPLYGFLKGDSLGLVLLVQDQDTVGAIGNKLTQAACMRVAPSARLRVYHDGRLLDPELSVLQAGLAPLDRIDVVPEDGK
jgi:toluene monooxygenase system protein B